MPEWLDLQLDRMLGNYFANRLPEMMAIVAELRPFIEEHGTLAQKARWFESLQLIDIRRCRFHQLPDETLENARRQVETARLSGNRRIKGRALAMLGFVHMWRGELDDAENAFLGSIKDAEAVGDVDTQFIDHYMGLIGRMRGDVELTRRWASSTLALARKVNSLYYQIGALGSLAWAALHEGDEQAARAYVQEGLALKKQAPSNTPWFMLLGPALVLDLRAGDYASAIAHVRTMLQPNQRWMPPELESLLGQAVAALDAGDVETVEALLGQGLQSLKQHQLGYV
jgi:hypothetical protein